MPEFSSAGASLHYVLAGPDQGPPIVLVHGFASDYELNWVPSRWQETLTRAGRLVVGLDCRGHGHSDKPHDPAAYDQRTMVEDVVRLLDHLGITRADLLGYSMGARIGLHMMSDHPDRLFKAILGGLGTAGAFSRAEAIAARMRGDETVTDPVALSFYAFACARPNTDLEALAACILGRQRPLADSELRRITVPALIVAGENDELARGAPALASRIPGARYLELGGRHHMNATPARQFKEAAVEFLAEE